MIVLRLDHLRLVVTQADHARFAADLLALMPAAAIARHPRRAALLRAVAAHDDGWWESDAAPRCDRTGGAPVDFRELPEHERLEIWRRGVERHAASAPYVAALIAVHAGRLLSTDDPSAERAAFLGELHERRRELAEACRMELETLARDGDWLLFADRVALVAATGDPAFAGGGFGARCERLDGTSTTVALEPFPFAGALTLELSCRLLPAAAFASDAELAAALATARWLRRPVRFVALPAPADRGSSPASVRLAG